MPAPPDVLEALAGRFDPAAFDAPAGRARLRLEVAGEGGWDALTDGERLELVPADRERRPDARLAADRDTWQRMARDVRGGMDAFRAGRLTVRDDLHLGVGFLAATSGMTEPGRLEVGRVRTGLRRAAQHLPRGARGAGRVLAAAARAAIGVAIRLGPARPAGPDRVRPPRPRGAAAGRARRARLRARPAARAPARGARGRARVPGARPRSG